MKKILLFILMAVLSQAYITATKGGLTENNILYFTNGGKIVSTQDKTTANFKGLNPDIYEYKPKEFKEVKSELSNEINDSLYFESNKIPLIDYKNILNYSLYYLNSDETNNKLFIKQGKKEIEANIRYTDEKVNTLFGELEVHAVYVTDKKGRELFKFSFNEDITPVEVKTLNKDYLIKRIVNDKVKKAEEMIKTKPIVLNGFDFYKEPIWASYNVNTNDGVRKLKTKFALEDKENDLFSVTLQGESTVFGDTKNTSNYEIDAFLIDLGNSLFEYQKLLKIDGENSLLWQQDPESPTIALVYLNDQGEQIEKGIVRNSKPAYDFAGVWYLVSWCDKHNKNSLKISYITTGRVEGHVNKTAPHTYKVSAGLGKNNIMMYEFKLDKYHRVVKVKDQLNNITMSLDSNGFLNQSILNNRKYIAKFIRENNLKVINEN